jgi:hypothetical protein
MEAQMRKIVALVLAVFAIAAAAPAYAEGGCGGSRPMIHTS